MKRIVFVTAGLGAGGAERVIDLISRAWVARGWTVTIIAFDGPNDPVFHAFDPRVTLIRMGKVPNDRPRAVAALLAQGRRVIRLRRTLAALVPDLVISFLTKVNVVTLIATIGTRFRVVVSERNNPRAQDASGVWNAVLARLYPRATSIVMQTRASLDCLPAGQRDRAWVIPNPISVPDSVVPALDSQTLVAVGRLTHQKGFDLLLDAFAQVRTRHPSWKLTIWGEGAVRRQLEDRVQAFGLSEAVTLPGNSRGCAQWISGASAMVLSSRYEGFPNVLGEAMAAGLPVVAFDCAYGPAEMIEHRVDGLLVPGDDINQLAREMDRIMADGQLRLRLGSAAAVSARRFSPDAIIARWDDVVLAALEHGQ